MAKDHEIGWTRSNPLQTRSICNPNPRLPCSQQAAQDRGPPGLPSRLTGVRVGRLTVAKHGWMQPPDHAAPAGRQHRGQQMLLPLPVSMVCRPAMEGNQHPLH
mmetsp:Transcript_67810/g.141757  ORF Transcript_67810/g.141757 Transcript_67810/m.141757 type:complete len:103 (-) Transcript_67810:540-848(-)